MSANLLEELLVKIHLIAVKIAQGKLKVNPLLGVEKIFKKVLDKFHKIFYFVLHIVNIYFHNVR